MKLLQVNLPEADKSTGFYKQRFTHLRAIIPSFQLERNI